MDKLASADLVIWSMPLYCYGMPSHVKALVDHIIVFTTPVQVADSEGRTHHESRRSPNTKHVLIAGCGFPDYEGNFDALVLQFQRLFGKDAPMILCAEAPMLSAPEAEILTKPYLETVRKAGQEFAQNGRINEDTTRILLTPMLDPEVYRQICSSSAL